MADERLFTVDELATLTPRQQLAFDYVRERDGATADEVGAFLHAHRDRRPHGVDDRCNWCTKDGRGVLTSKALAPLVRYRIDKQLGRVYIVRNQADRVRVVEPVREPTEAELAENPFAGLGVSSLDVARERAATERTAVSNTFENDPKEAA